MAVKIRLKRMGSKKNPFYRMVVADVRAPRDGRYIEEIGYYNPLTKEMKLDNEKAVGWIKNGAQPTETARALLKKNGAFGDAPQPIEKKPAKGQAAPAKKEEPAKEEPVATEAVGEEAPAKEAAAEETVEETADAE